MRLYQLTVSKDNAWDVMNEFGEDGSVQFLDLNRDEQPFNLPYTTQVKQCEESQRKRAYLEQSCAKNYVKVIPPKVIDQYLSAIQQYKEKENKAQQLLIEGINKEISDQEKFVKDQNAKLKVASDEYLELQDELESLNVAKEMIPEIQGRYAENRGDIEENNEEMLNLMNNDGNGGAVNIQQLAGVIETDDIVRLRRLVFRGTKGKSYMYIQQIDSDKEDNSGPQSKG